MKCAKVIGRWLVAAMVCAAEVGSVVGMQMDGLGT